MSSDSNQQIVSRFRGRVGIAVILLSIIGCACILTIGPARAFIRLPPHVSAFGTGFPGGTSYAIRGAGEPAEEVERLVGEHVDNWATQHGESIARSSELIARLHPGQAESVYLSLTAPRLSRRVLGRLQEFPRNEHYSLHLNLDIPEFTQDGSDALAELTNLDGLALGPRIRGISPKRDYRHVQITESDLAQVTGLQALRSLSFTHVKLPDAALLSIQGLPHLAELAFDDVQISPDGLEQVGRLTTLTSLCFQYMPVTDRNLSGLDKLASLERLWLNDTQITDAGLQHLEGMTNLREISLVNTRVTEIGVAKLRRALPAARITR
jgi:hypothetical protein